MNRRLTALAGASAAALTASLVQLPAAEAGTSEATVASASLAKICKSTVRGKAVKIRLGLILGDNGRDVENIAIRATDNGESGSFDNNKVNIKKIRLFIIDQDGKTQLSNVVAPSSPGSFDVGSAGEGAGLVRARLVFRVKGHDVERNCTQLID